MTWKTLVLISVKHLPTHNDVGALVAPRELPEKKRNLLTSITMSTVDISFQIIPSKGEANLYTIIPKKGQVFTKSQLNDWKARQSSAAKDGCTLSEGDNSEEKPINDPYGLNYKYHDQLHGWKAIKKQRPTGKYDMFYSRKCEGKNITYRSIAEVRRHIFDGYEKLKVEVDQETGEVRVSPVGVVQKGSMKRNGECSYSKGQFAANKHKSNNYDRREVEKLLANAKNNLMNMDEKHKYKDKDLPFKKRKRESSNLEEESATKDQRGSEHTVRQRRLRNIFNEFSEILVMMVVVKATRNEYSGGRKEGPSQMV
ncbi:hypothetical protein HAX54_007416, partial [Datura stramonium]|nr:hypothetical protein [Datura stramonium]